MEIDSLRVQLTDLLALHHDDDANEDDVVFATFDYIRYAHTIAQMLLLEGRFPELQRCLHLCQAAFGELAVADAAAAAAAASATASSLGTESADRSGMSSVAAVPAISVAAGAAGMPHLDAGPLGDDVGTARSSPGPRSASSLSLSVDTAAAVAVASRRQSGTLTLRSAEDRRVFAALASRTAQLQKQLEAAMRVRRGRDTEYYLQRLGLGTRDDDADDLFDDGETAASIRHFRRQLQRLPRAAPMTLQLTPPPSSRGGALGVSASAGGSAAPCAAATTPARAPPPPSRPTATTPNDQWKAFRLPSLSANGPFSAAPPPPSVAQTNAHHGGGGSGGVELPVAAPATGGSSDAAAPRQLPPPAPPERGIAIGGRSLLNRWKVRKELPPFVTAGRTFCVDREQAYTISSPAAGGGGGGGAGTATGRGRLHPGATHRLRAAQDEDGEDDAGLRAVRQLYVASSDGELTPQSRDETREQPWDSADSPRSPSASSSSSSSEWGPPPSAPGRLSPSPSHRRLHAANRAPLAADGGDGDDGASGQLTGSSSTQNAAVSSPYLSGRDVSGTVRGLSTSWLSQASPSRSRRRTAPSHIQKRAAPGLAAASVPASTVSGYPPSYPHGLSTGSPASASGAASPSSLMEMFAMRRHMLSMSTNTLASTGTNTTVSTPGLPLRVTLADDAQAAGSTTSASMLTLRTASQAGSSGPSGLHVAHAAIPVPSPPAGLSPPHVLTGPMPVSPSLQLAHPPATPSPATLAPAPQPILAAPPANAVASAARVVQVARQTTLFITASLKAQHHRTAQALHRCDELSIQRMPHHARAAATAALESRNTTAPSSETSSAQGSTSRGSPAALDLADGPHNSSPLSITTLGSPEFPPSIAAQLPERWVLPLARPPPVMAVPLHAPLAEAGGSSSSGVPVVAAEGGPLLTARLVVRSPPPPPLALPLSPPLRPIKNANTTTTTTSTNSTAATSTSTPTERSAKAAAAAAAGAATPLRAAAVSSTTSAASPVAGAGAAALHHPSPEAERQLRELRVASSRQLAASMAVVQSMEARWAEQHRQLETRVALPRLQDLSEWRRHHHHPHQHHHRRSHQRHRRSGQADASATTTVGAAATGLASHREERRSRHGRSPSPVPLTSVPPSPVPPASPDYGTPVAPTMMATTSAVLQWEGSGSGTRQQLDVSASGTNITSPLQRRPLGSVSGQWGGSSDASTVATTHPHVTTSAAETALPSVPGSSPRSIGRVSLPPSAQTSPSLPPSTVPAAAALSSLAPLTGVYLAKPRAHGKGGYLHPSASGSASSATSSAGGDMADRTAAAAGRSKFSASESSFELRAAGSTVRSMATVLPLHPVGEAPFTEGEGTTAHEAAPAAASTNSTPDFVYHPVVDALVRKRHAGLATGAAACAAAAAPVTTVAVGAGSTPPPSVSAVAVAAAPALYTVRCGDVQGHRVESALDSWRCTLQAMDAGAGPGAGAVAIGVRGPAVTDTVDVAQRHGSATRLAASATAVVASDLGKSRARHAIRSLTDDARQRRTQRVVCDALREAAMHVRPGDLVRPAWRTQQATRAPPPPYFLDLPNVFGGVASKAGSTGNAAAAVASSAAESPLHRGTSFSPTLRSSAARSALDASLLSAGSTNAPLSAGGVGASARTASVVANLTLSSGVSSPATATMVPSNSNTPFELRISPSRQGLPRTSGDFASAWMPPTVGNASSSSSRHTSVMPSTAGATAVFRQLHAVYRVGDVLLGCRDWTAVAPELLARSLHLSVRAVRLQQWWRRCLASDALRRRRGAIAAYLVEAERRDAAALVLQRQVRVHWAREAAASRAAACAILTEQRVAAERFAPRTPGGTGEDEVGGSFAPPSVPRAAPTGAAGSLGLRGAHSAGVHAPSTATSSSGPRSRGPPPVPLSMAPPTPPLLLPHPHGRRKSSIPLTDVRVGRGWPVRPHTGPASPQRLRSAHDTATASVFFLSARAAVAAGADGEGGDDGGQEVNAGAVSGVEEERRHRAHVSLTAASPLTIVVTAVPSTNTSPHHPRRTLGTSVAASAAAAAALAAARRRSSRMPKSSSPSSPVAVRARPEQRHAAACKLQQWFRRHLARLELVQLRRDVDVLSAVVTGRAPLEAVQLTLMPVRMPQPAPQHLAADRSAMEATHSVLGEVSFMSPFPIAARMSTSSSLMQLSAAAAALSASTAQDSPRAGEAQAMRRLLERCTGDVYGAFVERGREARRHGDYKTPLERVSLRELQGVRQAREEEVARQRQLVEWDQRRRLEQQQRRERQVLEAAKTVQRFGRGFRWRRWLRERQLKIRQRVDNNQVELLPRLSANEARDALLTATDRAPTLSMLTEADAQCAQLAGGAAVATHMRLRLQAAHPQWFGAAPSLHTSQSFSAHPTPEQLNALVVVGAFVQGFASAAAAYGRHRDACARSIQLAWRLFLLRRARRRARLRRTAS